MKEPKPPTIHTEPEHVRRKLAAALRKRSRQARWTDAERAEFARMAESWERTLPEKNK
jgi:hypothetical protein